MPVTTPLTENDCLLAKIDGQLVRTSFVKYCADNSQYAYITYNGKRYSRNLKKLELVSSATIAERNISAADANSIIPAARIAAIPHTGNNEQPSVAERFEFTQIMCDCVVEGHSESTIICGDPGMGKSRLVLDRMKHHELGPMDFIKHQGFMTPRGLYDYMYEHNGKLLIMDDCDSIFTDKNSENLLKAGLDNWEERRVSWGSSRETSGIPKEFIFTGRMICITNYKIEEVPEAFTSRSMFVDLCMTPTEKIERISQISEALCPDLTKGELADCLQLLDENKNKMASLNLRTMQQVGKFRKAQPTNWHRIASYMILAKRK